MKKEIIISSTLPTISGNFEEIQNELVANLKQYDLIVNQDSVKTAKKMATAINAISKNIDAKRIATVKELKAPIAEFENKAKALTTLCQESRSKLLTQVKKFEVASKEECLTLLHKLLDATYTKYGVHKEFQTITVDDLALVSNRNKTGLAKKAKDVLEARVLEAKQFQDKVDTRLLTLEGNCYKAGLQAPLNQENIKHFLYEQSDDVYFKKLSSLIESEVTRLREMKEKIEQEAIEKATQQNKISIPKPNVQPQERTPSKYAHLRNSGFAKVKKTYTVVATFEIEVDEKLEGQIEQTLLKRFKDAKFKTTPLIEVYQGVQNAA